MERTDRKVLEGYFQSFFTGGCSHHADFDGHLGRKVRKPNHRPLLVVAGIGNLNRVVKALHAQPEKRGIVRTIQYRPIGKLSRDHGAHALLAVQELNSRFNPVLLVDAYHQARLMIELMVFRRDSDLRFKVSCLFLVAEWTAVANEAVMGHAPIVCAGRRRFGQRIPGLAPMDRLIKPGAGSGLICHGYRKHTETRGNPAGSGAPTSPLFGVLLVDQRDNNRQAVDIWSK
jgi:hypothetical protein